MTSIDEIVRELTALLEKATPLPWCIESCGEKGDGSDMIGVAFHPDDKDAKKPLSGYLEEADADGNFIEYYRDELVAVCEHYPSGNPYNAKLIATALNATPALLSALARSRRVEEALTPSAETKAAYIGEFHFRHTLMNADGEQYDQPFTVPWTTIKEIMAAILARAALEDNPNA